MELINVLGMRCSLPSETWAAALELAQANGWKPALTLPPATLLEEGSPEAWDGAYYPACGQEVVRTDAAAVSRSLADAAAVATPEMRENLLRLAGFSARAGFLICPSESNQQAGILNLLKATGMASPWSRSEDAAAEPQTPSRDSVAARK